MTHVPEVVIQAAAGQEVDIARRQIRVKSHHAQRPDPSIWGNGPGGVGGVEREKAWLGEFA
jgi:hypothetical protein